MVDHKSPAHTPSPPSKGPVKENPAQKAPPSSNLKDEPHKGASAQPSKASDPVPTHDPSVVQPVVRPTETLPVQANRQVGGEPVGHARHAETPEEVEKINIMEHSKIPPPGSRNYVAGQPVNEEEYDRTEEEANRLAEAGRRQRTEAEQRMRENTPGDPDYHPVDPDHRDPNAGGKHFQGSDFNRPDDDDDDDDKKGGKR